MEKSELKLKVNEVCKRRVMIALALILALGSYLPYVYASVTWTAGVEITLDDHTTTVSSTLNAVATTLNVYGDNVTVTDVTWGTGDQLTEVAISAQTANTNVTDIQYNLGIMNMTLATTTSTLSTTVVYSPSELLEPTTIYVDSTAYAEPFTSYAAWVAHSDTGWYYDSTTQLIYMKALASSGTVELDISWGQLYNIYLNDYGGKYLDGTLKTYERETDGLVSTTTFDNTEATVYLFPDTAYYFTVTSSEGRVFTSEVWQPISTDLSHTITIVDIALAPAGSWAKITWNTVRNGGNVSVAIASTELADYTINIYNATNTLVDGPTIYTNVTSASYTWTSGQANQTYAVRLDADTPTLTGFKEVKFAQPATSPYSIPLFSSISGDLFSFAVIIGLAFTITQRSKGVGILTLIGTTALFVYLGWLTMTSAVVTFIVFVGILAAISYLSKEE